MKVKVFLGCLCLLIGFSFLIGNGAEAENEITLEFWNAQVPIHMQNYLNDRAKAFETVHPNVTVNVQSFPLSEYFQKFLTAYIGGSAPDVCWVDSPMIANYVESDILLCLDDYISEEEKEDYFEAPLRDMNYKGHIYTLVAHQSTEAIFYNKQMFEKAGITDIPTSYEDAWTWDEFLEVCIKVTEINSEKDKKVWALTHEPIDTLYAVQPYIYQNNGSLLSPDSSKADGYLNSPETVEALTWWRDMFYKYKLRTIEPLPDMLPTGNAAMLQGNPYKAYDMAQRYPDFEFGVMPLPMNVKRAVNCGGWHYCIPKQTKNREMALEFLKWMAGKEGHKGWIETSGYMPAMKSVYEALPKFKEYPYTIYEEGLEKYAVSRPVTPAWGFMNDTFRNILYDIATGTDVKTRLDTAVFNIERELKKYE